MKPLTLVSKDRVDDIIEYLQENVPLSFDEYGTGINETYVRQLFDSGALAFISTDSDGNITGLLVFHISDLLPTLPGEKVAIEHVWHSKGRTGHLLMKAYENFAKEQGCTKSFMGLTENAYADKIKSVYLKSNYKLLESTYIKEL